MAKYLINHLLRRSRDDNNNKMIESWTETQGKITQANKLKSRCDQLLNINFPLDWSNDSTWLKMKRTDDGN